MKTTHTIKLDYKYAEAVARGIKTFEVRFNDRDYKVDDIVIFNLINIPEDKDTTDQTHRRIMTFFSGKFNRFKIAYILKDFIGLADGYVAFTIARTN